MQCTQCGAEMKQIPAGVSKKTGQPYNAFMACPNKCGKTNYQGGNATNTATYQNVNKDEHITRLAIVKSLIESGKTLQEAGLQMDGWLQLAKGVGKKVPREDIPTIDVDEQEIPIGDIPF